MQKQYLSVAEAVAAFLLTLFVMPASIVSAGGALSLLNQVTSVQEYAGFYAAPQQPVSVVQSVKSVSVSTQPDVEDNTLLALAAVPTLPQKASSVATEKVAAPKCVKINRNLRIGDRGKDIHTLVTALRAAGFTIPEGTKNNEYSAKYPVFDEWVASAVVQFQQQHKAEILDPVGLPTGTGFVAKMTREKLQSYLGCGTSTTLPSSSTQQAPGTSQTSAPVESQSSTQPVQSEAVSVSAELLPTNIDRAGWWGYFTAWPGFANRAVAADWNWSMSLKINATKSIKSISIAHLNGFEAWSTSDAHIYAKQPYPLVVEHNGVQLNTAYNVPLGTYDAGSHYFKLFGQIESTKFSGATLTVVFTDGTKAVTTIPTVTFTPDLSAPVTPKVNLITPEGGEEWVTNGSYAITYNAVGVATVEARLVAGDVGTVNNTTNCKVGSGSVFASQINVTISNICEGGTELYSGGYNLILYGLDSSGAIKAKDLTSSLIRVRLSEASSGAGF